MGKSREGGKDHRRTSSKAPRRTARGLEHLGEAINVSLGVDSEEDSAGNDAVEEIIIPQEDPAPDQGESATPADSEDMQATDAVTSNGFFSYVSDFNTLLQGVYNSRAIATDKDSKISGKILAEEIDKVRQGKLAVDQLPDIGGLHAKVKELLEMTPASERQKPFVPKVIQPTTLSSSQGSSYTEGMAEAHSGSKREGVVYENHTHIHNYSGNNGSMGGNADSALYQRTNPKESYDELKKLLEGYGKTIEEQSKTIGELTKTVETLKSAPPPDLPKPPEDPKNSPKKPTTLKEDLGAEDDREAESSPTNKRYTLFNELFEKGANKKTEVSEADDKYLQQVLRNRGVDAAKKAFEQIKSNASKKDEKESIAERRAKRKEQHEKDLPEAQKMQDAEREYFKALKDFHKGRGFGSVFLDKFTGGKVDLPPEVEALRKNWVESRSGYAAYMKQSARERILARPGMTPEKAEEMLKRYNNIAIVKEVLIGAEEAENRARMEGLKGREKKFIERQFERFGKLPAPTRVLVSAGLMGITGAGAAALFASPLGLLGAAMAVPSSIQALRAMYTKDAAKKEKLAKSARFLSRFTFGGLFGWAGEYGVRKAHTLTKAEKKSEDKLIRQRDRYGDLGDADQLAVASSDRERAARYGERRDSQALWARIMGGVGGGMAGGALLGAVAPHDIAEASGAGALASAAVHKAEALGHGAAHAAPANPTFEHLTIGGHVGNMPINDGERLIGHFAEQLQHHRPHDVGSPDNPPAVNKLYELLSAKGHTGLHSKVGESLAARALGLEKADGSTLMKAGDTISLDHLQIVLDRPGHDMHFVLIDEKGTVNPLDESKWPLLATHHEAAHHAAHTADIDSHHAKDAPSAPAPAPEVPNAPKAPYTGSHDHDDKGLNATAHAVDLKRSVAEQAAQAQYKDKLLDYNSLVAEHQRAVDAYSRGLDNSANRAAYDTYIRHYEAYTGHRVPQATNTEISSKDTVSTQPVAQDTTHAREGTTYTAPTHEAPIQHTEDYDQMNTAAYDHAVAEARKLPPGTEVPYVYRTQNENYWNAVVMDSRGNVQLQTLVNSANGKVLPPPTVK
jgi:hypothetical protein